MGMPAPFAPKSPSPRIRPSSVNAVDLLSAGSWSSPIPRLLLLAISITFFHLSLSRTGIGGLHLLAGGRGHIRLYHFSWIDNAVELGFRHEAELQCGSF